MQQGCQAPAERAPLVLQHVASPLRSVLGQGTFGGPGTAARMNSINCPQSPKGVHAVVFCKISTGPSSVGSVAFRSAQRPGATGIDSVCFLRRSSIDSLRRKTCSWVPWIQQAIPLSSAAISKSLRRSASIWLSLHLAVY